MENETKLTVTAETPAILFAKIAGMPWRSLKIYTDRGVLTATSQTWVKYPGRAET
jgi:hypothetical protein